jgi:hypothetical protein
VTGIKRTSPPRSGRVRPARVTDLAALGELSRLSHTNGGGESRMRTLGLPVATGHVGVFGLFRLPLSAFVPGDLLYVYEERGRISGLARIERDSLRDEWTMVELDAIDDGAAGDIRFRLVQHLLRDASKSGGIRFHVACADDGSNVELFMQAGFARYGEERILYRPPGAARKDEGNGAGIRPAVPLDAAALDRLYRSATPGPVARLEDYRLHDWERQGNHWRVPRSSLTPILRFADVEAYVEEDPQVPAPDSALRGFCQIGVAKEDQPHYIRVINRPDHDPSRLISFGLVTISERTRVHGLDRAANAIRSPRVDRGLISVVRTYESPLDRRLEEHGFSQVATVSLLMKEIAVRVKEPAFATVPTR